MTLKERDYEFLLKGVAIFLLSGRPSVCCRNLTLFFKVLLTVRHSNVIYTTKLIHTSLSLSLSLLFGFKTSTCFGHHLPIFRTHYTNAVLVSAVCGCRCGHESLFIPTTVRIYNRMKHSPKVRLCGTSCRWASDTRNMSRL
jgi:hypothetical protein